MDKMVKAVCKVSHLAMNNTTYRRGDIISLPYENALKLGTSVEIITLSTSEKEPEPKPSTEKLVEGVKLPEKLSDKPDKLSDKLLSKRK